MSDQIQEPTKSSEDKPSKPLDVHSAEFLRET